MFDLAAMNATLLTHPGAIHFEAVEVESVQRQRGALRFDLRAGPKHGGPHVCLRWWRTRRRSLPGSIGGASRSLLAPSSCSMSQLATRSLGGTRNLDCNAASVRKKTPSPRHETRL